MSLRCSLTPRVVVLVSIAVGLGLGCGGAAEPAAREGASAAHAGGEPPTSAAQLEGSWVEFWALSGKADTQRYTFLADGRFGWTAAPASGAAPARRFGRYSMEGGELVLQVQGEDARADCTDAAPCRTFHDPARPLRLPIGGCPDNPEASQLDQGYRCAAIGGQAFWRSSALRADGLAELAR